MIDDEIDRIAGQAKKAGPARGPWWPAVRSALTVAGTAVLAWTASCSVSSPSAADRRDLEAHRAAPNFNVRVEEIPVRDEAGMELKINLSNLGPGDYPIFAAIQPLQHWAHFGPDVAARASPPGRLDAHIGPEFAAAWLRDPVRSGSYASITLSGIATPDRPFYSFSSRAITLRVYAGPKELRIDVHEELPPRPARKPPPPGAAGR